MTRPAVFAVSMVRDEADIIGVTVRNLQAQVDHVIVADNGSTDGTREILHGLGVEVIDDPERGYYQSAKMTALAHLARERGAEWVVPFDADELWYSPHGEIRDVLADLPETCAVVGADLYDHVCTAVDPDEPDPVARIGWRRRGALALPKVAVRARPDLTITQGNHGARYSIDPAVLRDGTLVVRHFPYRSAEQFVRKVRNGAEAYRAATGLPADAGAHWRQWGAILDEHGEDAVADIFRRWYWRRRPDRVERIEREDQPSLIFDPAPCRR